MMTDWSSKHVVVYDYINGIFFVWQLLKFCQFVIMKNWARSKKCSCRSSVSIEWSYMLIICTNIFFNLVWFYETMTASVLTCGRGSLVIRKKYYEQNAISSNELFFNIYIVQIINIVTCLWHMASNNVGSRT
jgi:hypothetical protein